MNIEALQRLATPLTGLAILAAAVVLLLQPVESQSQTVGGLVAAGQPRQVTVAPVRAVDAVRAVRFHGVIRASERATLAFPTGGRLLERPAGLGDRVRAGQVLARIDTRARADQAASFAASLDELEARIDQARRDRERAEQLHRMGATARAQVERARAQEDALTASFRGTQARMRGARRGHSDGVLRAPFDGVVTEVVLEPGEMATPGAPVLVLSGDGALEVEVQVPEAIVGSLGSEPEVRVDFPLADRPQMVGRVASVARTAAPGQLFPVVVALEEGNGLVAGMTAEVSLSVVRSDALSVPVAAVVDPAGSHPTIFVVREGLAVRQKIEIGDLLGDHVTVRGDLRDGEDVVIGGLPFLLDGDAVEVSP